jgi:hypothetical protein
MIWRSFALRINLIKDGDLISAKVVRIPLKTLSSGLGDQAQWEEEKDVKGGEYTLLNLLYAKHGSFLAELAEYLLRVEDMSRIHLQQQKKKKNKIK